MEARSGSRNAGFTLIEVMVALAVLGVSLFILLESQYATLSLFDAAQERANQRIFLEKAIGEAERSIIAGETSGEGDYGERYADYSFSFEATQMDESELPGLFEVTVTLFGPLDETRISFHVYNGNQVEIPTDR